MNENNARNILDYGMSCAQLREVKVSLQKFSRTHSARARAYLRHFREE